MGEVEESRVPRLKEGANFTSLPLEPADGYILSQIDGRMALSEIGLITGLGAERVLELVTKLEVHGVLEWIGADDRAASPSGDAPSTLGGKRPRIDTLPPDGHPGPERPRSRGAKPAKAKPAEERPAAPEPDEPKVPGECYTLSELQAEAADLGTERMKAILRTFHTMDVLTLYLVLRFGPDVEKKDIRTAYFKLSKRFHPDAMYGKDLGAFKAKMVAVFKRLTEAYEVLGKKKRRAEYDAYIGLRLKTLRVEQRLEEGKANAAEVAKVRESVMPPAMEAPPAVPASPAAAKAAPPGAPSAAPSPTPSRPLPQRSSAPARPSAQPSPRASAAPTSAAARDTKRRLMARKLAAAAGRQLPGQGRSVPPGYRASQPPRRSSKAPPGASSGPPPDKNHVIRGLATSLKMSAVHTGGVDLAQRYLAHAKRDEKAGDLVSAANYLRLATALAPERADLSAYHDRIAKELAVELADTYKAQAAYEEKNGKWAEAALSWGKVCDGRPNDPQAHWKAALGLLKAGGDLSRAKKYAQRAVDLDDASFDAKKTLGLIFHGAGMPESARRLLEAAMALDPRDEMVENLLRELR
ncbi:MAG: DnaJ domain-containing protein [Deltaproteobacteria bacterium]|nr:DnaJ domain-containing protein [Deltaproteobacteria bacterium]